MRILLLIFLTTTLFAKGFSLIINKPFSGTLFDVAQDYDGHISAVGFVYNFKAGVQGASYGDAYTYLASLPQNYGSSSHIVTVDSSAKILGEKSILLSNFNEALGVVKTPQNGYILGGNSFDGSFLLIRLDAKKELLFSKKFQNLGRFSKIVLLRSGEILAIGSAGSSIASEYNLFESGVGLNDIYIAKFSTDGEMLWQRKYGTAYDDFGVDATEADDGTIAILGEVRDGQKNGVLTARVSQNGDLIWLKHHKEQRDLFAYKLLKLRSGAFVASLSEQNEIGVKQIRLLKFDLLGNTLLFPMITTRYSSYLSDIKEFADGEFVGVGTVLDVGNSDGLVMILSQKLDLLHQEHFGASGMDALYGVQILRDSSFVAVGAHAKRSTQEASMWIVGLDRSLRLGLAREVGATKSAVKKSSAVKKKRLPVKTKKRASKCPPPVKCKCP